MNKKNHLFSHLQSDLPAGLVVFLVALPLCLGIALASGAPLFSGIIAGVIGGVVVGLMSGSGTSVSGPAAGLAVIVFTAIEDLGSYEVFLLAVIIAGLFQVLLGFAKAGVIGYYFPTSVIKGMLAGIGLILIIKQIPLILGINNSQNLAKYIPSNYDFESLSVFGEVIEAFHYGAVIISSISILILILWEKPIIKKYSITRVIPGALVVVIVSVIVNEIFKLYHPSLFLGQADKVELPVVSSTEEFKFLFLLPDFNGVLNPKVWIVAVTIAVIASLETLLSLEAADKIDPHKRVSPPNRELFAQGVGNMISGFIGGLPITAVIVRSSANITAGGRTKLSTVFHGVLLVISVLLFPNLLNKIPLAALAAILLLIGYKLARFSLFKNQLRLGWDQFLPFLVTVVSILIFDLLIGISLGVMIAIFFILLRNFQNSHLLVKESIDQKDVIKVKLSEEMSFLNKGALIKTLENIPENGHVIIDGSKSKIIDYDVLEAIENFKISAIDKGIKVETIKIKSVNSGAVH